jgi:hypothetical protein
MSGTKRKQAKISALEIKESLPVKPKMPSGRKIQKKQRMEMENDYYALMLDIFAVVLKDYFAESAQITGRGIWNAKQPCADLLKQYEMFKREVIKKVGANKQSQLNAGIELASQEVWLDKTYPSPAEGVLHPTIKHLDEIGLVYRDYLRIMPNTEKKKDAITELLDVPIKDLTKAKAHLIMAKHSARRAKDAPSEPSEHITVESAIDRLKNNEFNVLLSHGWGAFMTGEAMAATDEQKKALREALEQAKVHIQKALINRINATLKIIE